MAPPPAVGSWLRRSRAPGFIGRRTGTCRRASGCAGRRCAGHAGSTVELVEEVPGHRQRLRHQAAARAEAGRVGIGMRRRQAVDLDVVGRHRRRRGDRLAEDAVEGLPEQARPLAGVGGRRQHVERRRAEVDGRRDRDVGRRTAVDELAPADVDGWEHARDGAAGEEHLHRVARRQHHRFAGDGVGGHRVQRDDEVLEPLDRGVEPDPVAQAAVVEHVAAALADVLGDRAGRQREDVGAAAARTRPPRAVRARRGSGTPRSTRR